MLRLPQEILRIIIAQLEVKDMFTCRLVSKSIRKNTPAVELGKPLLSGFFFFKKKVSHLYPLLIPRTACSAGDANKAKELLDRSAPTWFAEEKGLQPLMIACKVSKKELVQLLLDRGASISATTKKQQTALHYAAGSGCTDLELYRILLQHGASADVNRLNKRGVTVCSAVQQETS